MPCSLTKSFSLDCKNGVGGVKEIKVKVMPSSLSGLTLNTDGSLTFPAPPDPLTKNWYTYQLNKEDGVFTEELEKSIPNRTIQYKQTLKFSMFNLTKDKQTELKLLAQNDLLVAFKLNDGTCWLIGYNVGADLTGYSYNSGKTYIDKNGYELTISCNSNIQVLDITTEYDDLTET